ncbi:hypothetical protein Droror1_Dr00025174 [Drosera rotundifolia]
MKSEMRRLVDLGFDDGGDSIKSALKMGFETQGDLGFRSGLGEEEACGGCGVLGSGVGEKKEERKRRRKEERKRRRKEESPVLCVFDFCRREKEHGLLDNDDIEDDLPGLKKTEATGGLWRQRRRRGRRWRRLATMAAKR